MAAGPGGGSCRWAGLEEGRQWWEITVMCLL
jgi:hypothetical protein